MIDKEIIINDVDVRECEKLGETIDGITCGLGKRIRFANEIITKHNLCKNNPNCRYKQLKRKEQECEELKQWKKDAENLFRTQTDNVDKIINRYKQALDKIEVRIQLENADDCLFDVMEIIESVKENKNDR